MSQFASLNLVDVYDPTVPFFQPNPTYATYADQKVGYDATSPRVAIHYQFSPDVFGYASYSQGFQSGGFNFGAIQSPFLPEKLIDYEVGLKSEIMNRRLRLNVDAFNYNYSNLQVNVTEGLQGVTANAAKAQIYGAEAQVTALPAPDLKIDFGVAWLHSEYEDYITQDPLFPGQGDPGVLLNGMPAFNLRGNQLAYAPKYKLTAAAAYGFHSSMGIITPRADISWVDRTWFNQFNQTFASQAAYAVTNLFVDFAPESSGWSASAFVRNATNKYYAVAGTVSAQILNYPVSGQLGPPRTYGISVSKRF
jgi:iron complex outermembrane receptor protein